jgi:hypothetical protein
MGKTLEDAGMLVKDENGELKVSDPTARKFLEVRNNLIDSGDTGFPFPCITVDEKSRKTTLKIYWEDKEKYPAFFKKWINGILLNELKILNVEGNIALPVYDPVAMGAKLDVKDVPNLPLPALVGALAMPPGSPLPLLMINLKFTKAIDASVKIPDLLLPPIPPIPALPVPVDVEFPSLSFEPIDFSLLGKHIALNAALPKMIENLLPKIASLDFLANFSPPGLFELACKVVSENNPPPPATNNQTDMGSYNINFAAVSAIKAEALGISTLGSLIGSSPSGITGNLGAEGKHRDPPPPPAEQGKSTLLEAGPTDYNPPHDDTSQNVPSQPENAIDPPGPQPESTGAIGIWTPAAPSVVCSNTELAKALSTEASYKKSWSIVMTALDNAINISKNSNYANGKGYLYKGDPRPFTMMHAQIVQGIIGNESGNGSKPAAGTINNWAGIECAKDKQGNFIKPTVGTCDSKKSIYVEYTNPSQSVQIVYNLLTTHGASHKDKTKGVSVPCYLLKQGPADRDEPFKSDPNDDRATFYRVYYSLR